MHIMVDGEDMAWTTSGESIEVYACPLFGLVGTGRFADQLIAVITYSSSTSSVDSVLACRLGGYIYISCRVEHLFAADAARRRRATSPVGTQRDHGGPGVVECEGIYAGIIRRTCISCGHR